MFRQLDEDGSGELDLRELGEAMKRIGLALPDDEVERMVAQSDVTNRLWTVTVANRLGSATCIIRMVTVEGVSELQYAAADIYAKAPPARPALRAPRLRLWPRAPTRPRNPRGGAALGRSATRSPRSR